MSEEYPGRNAAPGKVEKMAEKAVDQFGNVAEQVEDYGRAVADKGREVSHDVGEVATRFKGAVDKSVKDQPITTLALVAVLGFALGALWKL